MAGPTGIPAWDFEAELTVQPEGEVITPSERFELDLAERLRHHRPEARKPLARLAPVLRILAVLDMDQETTEALTAWAEAS